MQPCRSQSHKHVCTNLDAEDAMHSSPCSITCGCIDLLACCLAAANRQRQQHASGPSFSSSAIGSLAHQWLVAQLLQQRRVIVPQHRPDRQVALLRLNRLCSGNNHKGSALLICQGELSSRSCALFCTALVFSPELLVLRPPFISTLLYINCIANQSCMSSSEIHFDRFWV
jgi:hypothetical protein